MYHFFGMTAGLNHTPVAKMIKTEVLTVILCHVSTAHTMLWFIYSVCFQRFQGYDKGVGEGQCNRMWQ